MSNDTPMRPHPRRSGSFYDIRLPLVPGPVTGYVIIRPNGLNQVFVDARQNSRMNEASYAEDDHSHPCFVTYRGKDYVLSGNWKMEAGTWQPCEMADEVAPRRSASVYDRAPKTYAPVILAAIRGSLDEWLHTDPYAHLLMAEAHLTYANRKLDTALREEQEAAAAYEAAGQARMEAARNVQYADRLVAEILLDNPELSQQAD